MNNKYSKEEIKKIVLENAKIVSENITNQYLTAMDNMNDEQKNNPITRELACISIAINDSNQILINSLYQLLNR